MVLHLSFLAPYGLCVRIVTKHDFMTAEATHSFKFYVHGSVHRESVSIIVQQDATIYSLLHFCKLLYMFRVVTPPIIRSTYNRNYSIWHWSNRLCYLPLWWRSWNCRSARPCPTTLQPPRSNGKTRGS
jgi:hypothetical protein